MPIMDDQDRAAIATHLEALVDTDVVLRLRHRHPMPVANVLADGPMQLAGKVVSTGARTVTLLSLATIDNKQCRTRQVVLITDILTVSALSVIAVA